MCAARAARAARAERAARATKGPAQRAGPTQGHDCRHDCVGDIESLGVTGWVVLVGLENYSAAAVTAIIGATPK